MAWVARESVQLADKERVVLTPAAAAEVLDWLGDPVVLTDDSGTIVWANQFASSFSGIDVDEVDTVSVFDLLHPDDHALVLLAFDAVVSQEVGELIDVRIRNRAGEWRQCEVRGKVVEGIGDDDQTIVALVFRDTADRQRLEFGAGDFDLLRALVHHSTALLVQLDDRGNIVTANGELSRMLHQDLALVRGRPFASLVHRDDVDRFLTVFAAVEGTSRFDVRLESTTGTSVHVDLSLTDLRADPLFGGYVLSGTDVTDLKVTQEALRHMADHDALTGLMSRRALLAELDGIVADGYQHEIVVLFCDLDGFKAVNDRIGHAAGDQVLVEVARRMERSIRPGDLVGRLGGDEFVVVLPRASAEIVAEISDRIRAELCRPIVAGDEVVEVDVSMGWATTGDHPTASRLLSTADDAMYAVKRGRRSSPVHERAT